MSTDKKNGLVVIVWAVASIAAACTGGGASRGERCDTVADCADDLQCLDHICKPECRAAFECGDGMVCTSGSCVVIHSAIGDPCEAELECGPGQTCRLPLFAASAGFCEAETLANPIGATCAADDDCRAGVCSLGRCTELCARDDQCRRSHLCAAIPRVTPDALRYIDSFRGCLPSLGNVTFEIPIDPTVTSSRIQVPVPSTARSMVLIAEVAGSYLIGALNVWKPSGGAPVYALGDGTVEQYYANKLRHQLLTGVSVLAIPTTTEAPLEAGPYTVEIGSRLREIPTATPRRVRVVEKLGNGATLDVHFYFLDLDDHPCGDPVDALNAANAPDDLAFQTEYVEELRDIFGTDIALGEITYTDLRNHPELDGLTLTRAGDLFELTTAQTGISVFFVRSLSPAGLEVAVGGTPGSPLPGTRASGIAVAASALCYESWRTLARQTAHAMARHMGLYRNVEPDGHTDPLVESPTAPDNLMYWGEDGGTNLSRDQRAVLLASPVLR